MFVFCCSGVRNGSGKTTLMTLLTGQDHPSSGQALIDGIAPYKNEQTLGLTIVISILVGLLIQRLTGSNSALSEYINGAKYNAGVLWATTSYFGYYDTQMIATNFPFALSLGASRKNFTLGTFIAAITVAVTVALLALLLLFIEKLTGHWFMNIYVFDVYPLGNGNPLHLLLTLTATLITTMSVFGFFVSIWLKWGPKGVIAAITLLTLTLTTATLIFSAELITIIKSITAPGLTLTALTIAVATLAGQYLILKKSKHQIATHALKQNP